MAKGRSSLKAPRRVVIFGGIEASADSRRSILRGNMRTVQMLSLVVALSLLTIRPASALFFESTLPDLMAAKSLKCTFTSAIGINPAKPWPTTKSITVKEVRRFDHIDLQKGTA